MVLEGTCQLSNEVQGSDWVVKACSHGVQQEEELDLDRNQSKYSRKDLF